MPLAVLLLASLLRAEPIPPGLAGDWSLDLESGEPAWMRVVEHEGQPRVYMRIYIGSDGPFEVTTIEDGRLEFAIQRRRKKKDVAIAPPTVSVGLVDGKLDGLLIRNSAGGKTESIRFTGKQIPPMPALAPDLENVRFGAPISLFNGKDLSGWRPHEPNKTNGWSALDGMLVNSTTKTDFSPTGAYANLRTVDEFEDFRLHIEFLVEAQRNSGIYLRGIYEAQVVDRDSRMQGIQGVGAIFGRIAPTTNAGKPGGEWQTYDLTLVDRHVTVVLNGVTVIDNQPVSGPTGGAIYTDPAAPGPIYLQGDHTSVRYRNITLAPIITGE
jgi:hypothetical protein